jgi:hypothetical protein
MTLEFKIHKVSTVEHPPSANARFPVPLPIPEPLEPSASITEFKIENPPIEEFPPEPSPLPIPDPPQS